MPFSADSAVVSRVVESPSSEVGSRNGASIDAIVIHMAEGGGTVEWLTRPDGNSSHYVVRYTGQIVQMVRESYWAGSINPRLVRTDDDRPYTYQGLTITYGRTEATRCLGSGVTNPNLHVIAVEVEGFAKDGPNAAQRKALANLVGDIRRRRGWLPCLGHRDFQNYKACPGKLIPWIDYGGHGKTKPQEETVAQRTITTDVEKLIDIPIGTDILDLDGETKLHENAVNRLGVRSPCGRGSATISGVTYRLREFYLDADGTADNHSRRSYLVRVKPAQIHDLPAPEPVPAPATVTYELTLDGQPVATGTYTKP